MLSAGLAILAGTLIACLSPQTIDGLWFYLLPIVLYLIYRHVQGRLVWIFIASFLWTHVVIHWQLDHRLSLELNNKRVNLVGKVLDIPTYKDGYVSLLIRPHKIEGYKHRLPRQVKLTWRHSPGHLVAGQVWSLAVKIKRPHGFQNPGGFDYERWLFIQGIDATGYVLQKPAPVLLESPGFSINYLRQNIITRLQLACDDCAQSGLIQALSIGYRGNISADHRELLKQTGTAHLIAISGLHIGIIAGVFFSIGLWIWRLPHLRDVCNRREFALLVSWIAALIYSLLAGFELPAQRALIMLTVVFASLWLRLPVNLLNSLMTALILILVFSPLTVLSASFWLSFSALLIIVLGQLLMRKPSSRLHQFLSMQGLFSILFVPLTIIIFNQLHLASYLANLVAVPLVGLIIVPLNFFFLSLLWLPLDFLRPCYILIDSLLTGLIHFLQGLQSIGFEALNLPTFSIWQLMLIVLWLFLLILPRGLSIPAAWSFLIPIVLLWPVSSPGRPTLTMAVLDVGMGTAIVLHTANHVLAYDFGPGNPAGYSLGRWVVKPYLQHYGLKQIDRLVISHSDQDHLGGLYAIHNDLDYASVYSGTPDKVLERIPALGSVRNCHETDPWIWDGIHFAFLSNGKVLSGRENNHSCVLSIQIGHQKLLLTGDIESRQEQLLLWRYTAEELQAEILVAPHHGSLTSSSKAFVETVMPGSVIFTSGYLNRWRFPRPAVVRRYQQVGSEIYQTDQDGAILIECNETSCHLKRWRQIKPRLWY